MNWKLYITDSQQRTLEHCRGSMEEGDGFGFGYGNGWGNGYGSGYGNGDGDGGSDPEWE